VRGGLGAGEGGGEVTSEAYVKSRYPDAVVLRWKHNRASVFQAFDGECGPSLGDVTSRRSSAWVSAALAIRSQPQPARAKEGGEA